MFTAIPACARLCHPRWVNAPWVAGTVAVPDTARAVLEARGLVRAYGGFRAVDGLDLTVREGEIYGLLGRNGAGKTTTIRMLMGIIRPDAGTVAFLGQPARAPTAADKRRIGYVAQEQHFYPWMTCAVLGRFVRGFYPSWDEAYFERLLEAFEIPRRRKVSDLSHGMRVKLALALAIAPRPPLLILDEPTAGLDPVARREFLQIVQHHARAGRQTVFFSSHIMEEVERVADRVGILDRGRMLFEGTLAELRATVRAVRTPPAGEATPAGSFVPPPGFQVLEVRPDAVIMSAGPAQWEAHPELAGQSAGLRLTLDDLFVAMVLAPPS